MSLMRPAGSHATALARERAGAGRSLTPVAARRVKPRRSAEVPNYRHAWLLAYTVVYVPVFFWLERQALRYHIVSSPVDSLIPFNEWFVLPYLGWFVFMGAGIVYTFFTSQDECCRLGAVLIIGMSLACVTYWVWPSMVVLRPSPLVVDNFAGQLVAIVYAADTSTNVFPSIHVYNTLAVMTALARSPQLRRHKGWLVAAGVFSALIILSTLFIKQHSVLDAFGAAALILLVTPVVHAVADRRLVRLPRPVAAPR
jgi:membrane-associated phospholipid phosphatase